MYPLVQVLETFRSWDRNYYCYNHIVDANKKASDQYYSDVNKASQERVRINQIVDDYVQRQKANEHFTATPIPPTFNTDPKHPHNLCYQCHRPLPSQPLPWNFSYPLFDTLKCKQAAVRRHIRPFDQLQVAEEDRNFYELAKRVESYQQSMEAQAEQIAFTDLTSEYHHYIADYERVVYQRTTEELLKQQEREERERIRLQQERERQIDRERREQERLVRDAERQEDRERRETERFAREEEKRLALEADEKARREEEEKWKPRPFNL